MDKAKLGTKRICQSCNKKYYDLNKEDPACPMCGARLLLQQASQSSRNRPAASESPVEDIAAVSIVAATIDEAMPQEADEAIIVGAEDISIEGLDDFIESEDDEDEIDAISISEVEGDEES